MYQVGFGLCSGSLNGATEERGGIAVIVLDVRALGWSPLANVTPGLLIAFIALAFLGGNVLWLAIEMGLGMASLALDGIVVWKIMGGLVR